MAKVIEAVYENGVFRPLEKVELKKGERVRIRIEKEIEKHGIYNVIKNYQKYFEDVEEDLTKILLRERR